MGVGPGSHVAVWLTNLPQWYIAFWAATKIGAVLVTVNTAYKIHEAEYLLKQSDTHTLILEKGYRDSDYSGIIAELCPELADTRPGEHLHSRRLPFLRNVVTVGYRQAGCLDWEQMTARANRTPIEEVRRLAAAVDPHDVCNMQYTSGTTGFPKGVMLTHYNIVNNGKCIGDRMDLSTADRMMIQVPMFHCFGMVLAMTACATHGSTMLPLPYFSPRRRWPVSTRSTLPRFTACRPCSYAMLEHPDFAKTDFSYMRTGIMAGSPCPIKVSRTWWKRCIWTRSRSYSVRRRLRRAAP
jgi:fatty-acyl-CoA synthase